MIKIVQGVYGHYTGKSVEPKDKNSEPFELAPKQEKRLIEQGIAVHVDEQPKVTEEPPAGEKSIDDMTAKELREYGKTLGLTFKVGTKNAEMREVITAHLTENEEDPAEPSEDEEGEETTEVSEPAPSFDPTEAVQ